MDLPTIWFVLLGVLLAGYAILDGFDLGVGILHPLARDRPRAPDLRQRDRAALGRQRGLAGHLRRRAVRDVPRGLRHGLLRLLHRASCCCSWASIFRAVSLEFRSKREAPGWRRFWDGGFFVSSLARDPALRRRRGQRRARHPARRAGHLHRRRSSTCSTRTRCWSACSPWRSSPCTARCSSTSRPKGRCRSGWGPGSGTRWGVFLILYLLVTMFTLVAVPRVRRQLRALPVVAAVVVLNVVAIANIPRADLPQAATARPSSPRRSRSSAWSGLFGLALYPEPRDRQQRSGAQPDDVATPPRARRP